MGEYSRPTVRVVVRNKSGTKEERNATSSDSEEEKLAELVFGVSSKKRKSFEDGKNSSVVHVVTKKNKQLELPSLGFTIDVEGTSCLLREGDGVGDHLNCEESSLHEGFRSAGGRKPVWTESERYATTTSKLRQEFEAVHGNPSWAELDGSESESTDAELLNEPGGFLDESRPARLPKGILDIKKHSELGESRGPALASLGFHPAATIAMTATRNGRLSLYRVDEEPQLIQSVFLDQFSLRSAAFVSDGSAIVAVSNSTNLMYSYDLLSGKFSHFNSIQKVRNKRGSLRSFRASPDGRWIVLVGSRGYIHVVANTTYEYVTSFCVSSDVVDVGFAPSGQLLVLGSENTGYVYDVAARRCVHTFLDIGAYGWSTLAVSCGNVATGSRNGVVNVYPLAECLNQTTVTPTKSLGNLTTTVSSLHFNSPYGDLLVAASNEETAALRLVQLPSLQVFSNFPTRSSTLGTITCLGTSPNSGYIGFGNSKGFAKLYRLGYYNSY